MNKIKSFSETISTGSEPTQQFQAVIASTPLGPVLTESPEKLRARGATVTAAYVARWNREQRAKSLELEKSKKDMENMIASLAEGREPGIYPVYSGASRIGTLRVWKSGGFMQHEYTGQQLVPRLLPLRIPPVAKAEGNFYHPDRGWY